MNNHPPMPRLPFMVRLMNSMPGAGRALVRLDAVSLLAAARRSTGLSDFGDPGFREGLGMLVESLERDAALTTLGRFTARATIIQALENRLRVNDHIKNNPSILKEEIKRPLFIIGLPRTGTTILQALLDRDPANRSLLSWEALSPCPPPRSETYGSDPRIGTIQNQFDRLYAMAPGFMAAHPMSSAAPQECVTLFCMEFLSQQFIVQFDVRRYQDWLDGQDMGPAYRLHRNVLRLLQSGGVRGTRWLLKSPAHLNCIDDLLATYPDAAIVHTHRDPATVAASLASLMSMLRSISSDRVNPPAIARHMLDWYEKLLAVSMAQRRRHAHRKGQFLDLTLEQIARNPLGTVDLIYDHFGFDLSKKVRQDMEGFMAENPRDRHGDHSYTLEDFGIDPAQESRRFEAYTDYFNMRKTEAATR